MNGFLKFFKLFLIFVIIISFSSGIYLLFFYTPDKILKDKNVITEDSYNNTEKNSSNHNIILNNNYKDISNDKEKSNQIKNNYNSDINYNTNINPIEKNNSNSKNKKQNDENKQVIIENTKNNSRSKISLYKKSRQNFNINNYKYIYTIQIASFKKFDYALALKKDLIKKGFNSFIIIKKINDIYYYRVNIGLFKDKKSALTYLKYLKNTLKMQNLLVFRYSSSIFK